MIKIFKLAVVVAIATLVGIWINKYSGFIMLVVAGKSIKISLVAFIFIFALIIFCAVLGFRIIKFVASFPYIIFSWLVGLFVVNRQEKFVDLIADISLEHNIFIKKTNISQLLKLTPSSLQDYILFKKLNIIAGDKNIKELDLALKQIAKHNLVYDFFKIYKQYLECQFSAAKADIKKLLKDYSDKRLMLEITNLAVKIVLAIKDNDFAIELLENYNSYLHLINKEDLTLLILKEAKNASELTVRYNQSDATIKLNRIYVEQLLKFDDKVAAQKIMKKQFGASIDSKMLYMCDNAFNLDISKLYQKLCNQSNKDYSSMLALLDLTILKSNNYYFKMIYEYIENNIKTFLSQSELEKYRHILCKFYIKNGSLAGIDLSAARLVYGNY